MRNRKREATAAAIVDAARAQVGYHAQPQKQNGFSPKSYLNKDWNGAFIDRVLRTAFGAEPEVSFLSTVTALGYYASHNGLYRKPRVGDVVFFNFSTDPGEWDHQPHVGVCVEVKPGGALRTVEAQTFSGKPQGVQLADGVHERERYATDILAVVRPQPARTVTGTPDATVRMSYFDSNPSTKSRAVETVQRALNRVRPAFTFNRGKRDGTFRSAVGVYARETGMVENRGDLTQTVLKRLANETGTFTLE